MMKITLSQKKYEVRDASEISFGLFIMGILLILPAFIIGFLVTLILPSSLISTQTIWALSAIAWITSMILVVLRYLSIARRWNTQRRGSDTIHLVEWICGILGALLLIVPPNQSIVSDLRIFFGALVILLVFSHLITFVLLRYRPRKYDVVVWIFAVTFASIEVARNA